MAIACKRISALTQRHCTRKRRIRGQLNVIFIVSICQTRSPGLCVGMQFQGCCLSLTVTEVCGIKKLWKSVSHKNIFHWYRQQKLRICFIIHVFICFTDRVDQQKTSWLLTVGDLLTPPSMRVVNWVLFQTTKIQKAGQALHIQRFTVLRGLCYWLEPKCLAHTRSLAPRSKLSYQLKDFVIIFMRFAPPTPTALYIYLRWKPSDTGLCVCALQALTHILLRFLSVLAAH